MIQAVKNMMFGKYGGMTRGELLSKARRDQFSDFLPWVAYDRSTQIYLNIDNTHGFIWECNPLCFAGENTTKIMEGMFRLPFPEGTVMQFILHADPHIEPILDAYGRMKYRGGPLVKGVTESLTNFYREGNFGLAQMSGIPMRNFRLFFTFKVPGESAAKANLPSLQGSVMENLRGAGLCPKPVEVEDLLDWGRRLFNAKPSETNNRYYNDYDLIRRQMLLATEVKSTMNHLEIDGRYFRCITPRSYPKEVHMLQTNELFGGIEGLPSDGVQIRSPFIFTLNVIMSDTKTKLRTKCELLLKQQGFSSYASSLNRKKEENLWAVDSIDRGIKFYQVVPCLWLYDKTEDAVNESVTRARRMWDGHDYVMQEDKGILPILLISSLPLGLYDVDNNISNIDRDFPAPIDAIANTLPVQGDFSGFGRPAMLFTGRKGQLFGIDLFDKGANNFNAFCAATSGGGKSFLVNYMVYNYYSMGVKIRIIDIGASYKKMTRLFGAQYLDFDENTQICLNPFSSIKDPDEELQAIVPIAAAMCFSNGGKPSSIEMELINQAVRWAWNKKHNAAGIDEVAYFLENYSQLKTSLASALEIVDASARLAFTIQNFTSKGAYGRFFNGPSTFDISNDDFVVLELQNLKSHPQLYNVITLQVIDAVTRDLYLSDRSDRRMIIFDEAFEFLGDNSLIQDVIEEGYRRCRKFSGSFTVITQNINDLRQFGSVGEVIRSNSAFKFYLESPSFEQAKADRLLDYDDFTMKILKSTKSNKPNYSEIFMDTPFGYGVGRLVVDPYSYYVFTSDGNEVAEIESLLDEGMTYEQAIKEMVRRHRNN